MKPTAAANSIPPSPSPLTSGHGWKRRSFLGGIVAGGAAFALPQIWVKAAETKGAQGFVFHDKDGDGRKGAGDKGLAGIMVSNGRDVVLTDESGRWELPLLDGPATSFFVVKPKGYAPPTSADLLPRHFYLHQPEGSPKQKFAGVKPSGPLPASIDFPLLETDESNKFRMLVCGDPQPRNLREVDYLARSTPAALREAGGLLGITLGDVAFDNLTLYPAINKVFASTGMPWRHVLGNHDLNVDSADDVFARETFRSTYGPTYYSFDQGEVHFVVLDNVRWKIADPKTGKPQGGYSGGLGERQLQWLKADLAHVAKERLVVLFMHIPLRGEGGDASWSATADRKELYKLLVGRPNTLSFAAHRHYHRHDFIGAEDGWTGAEAHHHLVVGTLCGSWFQGVPDAFGVPHATMSDGTPRGFLAADFDGNTCKMDGFHVIGAPSGQQMHIALSSDEPAAKDADGMAFHVNYYNGSERSTLRYRIGAQQEWLELKRVLEPDPHYFELLAREGEGELAAPFIHLGKNPDPCSHLWKGNLPVGLGAGEHVLEVMAEDGFGHSATGLRILRVKA